MGDPVKRNTVVRVQFRIGDIMKARAQEGNDVEAALPFTVPKQFAHQPLRPVPAHCPAKPPRRDDAEPVPVAAVRTAEQRQETAPGSPALLLNRQKLWTPTDPLTLSQGPIHRPAQASTAN